MRPPLPRVALFALLLAVPSTSLADDYSDFRVPDYRLVSLNLNLTGSLNATRYGPEFGREHQSSGGRYSFQTPFRADDVTDRRERSAFLYFASSAFTDRLRHTGGSSGVAVEDERVLANRGYSGVADWFESRYPDGGRLAWNYGASVQALARDEEVTQSTRYGDALNGSSNSSGSRSERYEYGGSASLGLGLGRIRDVSGVYEAQVLEARLLETGRLLRPLTTAERQRLAEVFYLSDGIGTVHDRPSKYLWAEIERVLAADGALEDGALDAWSALRALEPVMLLAGSNRRAGRFVGSFGFVSAERGHSDVVDRQEFAIWVNGVIGAYDVSEVSSRTPIERDDAGVGLEWAEHHPLSMRSQVDLRTRLTLSSHQKLAALLSGSTRYLIADRWDATLTGVYQAQAWSAGEGRSEPDWLVLGNAAVAYLLEDSWTLQVTLNVQQEHIREADVPEFFQSFTTLSLGVTYRPVGRLSAPIAGLASRPMVGGR
jgi:hypothetical protein